MEVKEKRAIRLGESMEILETILAFIIVGFGAFVCIVGSLAAGEESAMRKKQMKAGTHDYYGNKLGDD